MVLVKLRVFLYICLCFMIEKVEFDMFEMLVTYDFCFDEVWDVFANQNVMKGIMATF